MRKRHLVALAAPCSIVGKQLATFRESPPRQQPGTFSIDQVMEKLREPH